MTARLDLLTHGATAAIRTARFPDNEALETKASAARAARLPRSYDIVLSSPARAALETARVLDFEPEPEPALRDCDYGRWRGLGSREVAEQEPDAFATWLSDPLSAPHGGESLTALIERVSVWLAAMLLREGAILAITHAAVVRAATVSALGAHPSAFWRIDAAPLSLVRLTGRAERWNLAAFGGWDCLP